MISPFRHSFRKPNSFTSFTCRTEYFNNSFFQSVINDRTKLDPKIRNSTSYLSFRNALINFIRPSENQIFNIHDEVCIKLLTRLRLGVSHLREHKFRRNFADILNPLCPCSIKPETTMHFFLRCHFCNVIRASLMSDLLNIDSSLSTENDEKLLDILLYGNSKLNTVTNQNILICTLKLIKDSYRFDNSLFKGICIPLELVSILLYGLYTTLY